MCYICHINQSVPVMKHPVILILTAIMSVLPVFSQNDSQKEKVLDEVTVVASRGWVEKDKIVLIPTKREKNLSNSPESLIKQMNLSMLRSEDGKIVGASGNPATIFINGVKADDIDLKTFWPHNAKRVEYYENPTDPVFGGASCVVNFIMTEYSFGGVTKIDGTQGFPSWGSYSASSKLAYKKMTYGAKLTAHYKNYHGLYNSGTESYRDIFYDGEHYDLIERKFEESIIDRYNSYNLAFNARYKTATVQATHNFALGFDRNPGDYTDGQNSWSDNLFESTISSSFSKSKSFSPQLKGDYYFKFSDKWSLLAGWTYINAHTSSNSGGTLGGDSEILNGSTEDVNKISAYVCPTFILSDKWYFQLNFINENQWFDIAYNGSSDDKTKQTRWKTNIVFKANWKPRQNLNIYVCPILSTNQWKIGDVKETDVQPVAKAGFNWNISRKVAAGGMLSVAVYDPAANKINPALVRVNELEWVTGNPYLKSFENWKYYIYSSFMLSNSFNFTPSLQYERCKNDAIPVYMPAPQEMGGLIKSFENTGAEDWINAKIYINGSFFNGRLTYGIDQWVSYFKYRGKYAVSKAYYGFRPSLGFRFGNFQASLSYLTPRRLIRDNGMRRSWHDEQYNCSLTYGSKNLYISMDVLNIFNKKEYRSNRLQTPYYSSETMRRNIGLSCLINVTYTFDYGKKIDRSIDVQGPEGVGSSSVL